MPFVSPYFYSSKVFPFVINLQKVSIIFKIIHHQTFLVLRNNRVMSKKKKLIIIIIIIIISSSTSHRHTLTQTAARAHPSTHRRRRHRDDASAMTTIGFPPIVEGKIVRAFCVLFFVFVFVFFFVVVVAEETSPRKQSFLGVDPIHAHKYEGASSSPNAVFVCGGVGRYQSRRRRFRVNVVGKKKSSILRK